MENLRKENINMDYEFIQDSSITVNAKISCINATFGEDRKNVIGVYRMTNVKIECDDNIPHKIISGIQNQIFNHFAAEEYNTEDSDWKNNAANDIREYTGVSNVNIEWE